MIINHTLKFIFVHVPKAAGSSVSNCLSKLSRYRDLEIGGTILGEALQPEYIRRFGLSKHSTAAEVRRVTGEMLWTSYFTFGFVRNPYERAFSIFNFMTLMANRHHRAYSEMLGFKDFGEFLLSDYFQTDGPDRILRPQLFWLQSNDSSDEPAVQFVGRVDEINDSLRIIEERLGRGGTDIRLDQMPRVNESAATGQSVWDELKDRPELEEIIFKRYQPDFRAFGFQRSQLPERRDRPALAKTELRAASRGHRQDLHNLPREIPRLFVCGFPQAGKSCISSWLTSSGQIVVGLERYQRYWLRHLSLPADAFSPERFFEVKDGDTWYDSLDRFGEHYQAALEIWPQALFVGDQIPTLWKNFSSVASGDRAAKIIYCYRDPFALAVHYKTRSLNDTHSNWGKHLDAGYAVNDWNESVNRLLDFLNSESHGGDSPAGTLFVLNIGDFLSNCCDKYGLTSFLGGTVELPTVGRDACSEGGGTPAALSNSERELVWSLQDVAAHREILRRLGEQKLLFSARRWRATRPPRLQWYHSSDKRDADIEYGEYQIAGCNYVFRGRVTPVKLEAPYAACIGSATTFGRFVRNPYPAQLEAYTGVPFLNLGIGGGRPESYLIEETLLQTLREASVVIMEVMSARGYSSPIFEPKDPVANMGYFKDFFELKRFAAEDAGIKALLEKARSKEPVFVDRVYERAFGHLTASERDLVRDSLESIYARDWVFLMQIIAKPVVVLYMSRNSPYQARINREPKSHEQWSGEYPHFVDELFLDYLRHRGARVVVSASQRGFPFLVKNWRTDQPAPVFPWKTDSALNTYYPSQEMHDDAFQALIEEPLIKELLGQSRESSRHQSDRGRII